jgi:uncharacterized membrane protein (DUF485 family)
MVLKDAATAIQAQPPRLAGRNAIAASLRRDLLPTLLLALLALALTVLYYATAYSAEVRADDRVRGLFVGFQSLEGEDQGQPYRWTKGEGTVCLPAPGLSRPLAAMELRLLGSAVTAGSAGRAVDAAELRLGPTLFPLAIAPEARAYRLLVPPDPGGGPVCATITSATVDPAGTGRVTGVGLRSIALWKLERGGLPPPGQLLANLALSAAGYLVLRRLGLPRLLAFPIVLAVIAGVGAGLIGGAIRLAPDLPYWSGFAAASAGLILGALLAYQWSAPRLAEWQREILGTALILALLAAGWAVLSRLEGYLWPFPIMARGGTAFGLGALPAALLFAAYAALVVRWLRAPAPPPAWLAIGAAFLAAFALPVALKAGLRGWESLFQHFAVQEGNYIQDLPRVGGDPLGFLRGYVALMPELALHNKTHPPGGTLFLWAVERLVAPGPEAATWAVIALAALGVWPTYRLAAALLGPRAAALAAALYALLPAFMIYAATSMDAMFATVLACATSSLYAALVVHDRPGALAPQLLAAAAAGAWIALGLLFSFTTLMLALVVLALLARRLAVGPRRREDALRWAAAGGAIAGTVLLLLGVLWAATGYNSVAAFFMGVANNRLDVGARVSPLGLSSYLFFLAVNAVAFGWYLGPWVIYRLGKGAGSQIARSAAGVDRPADALGAGMAGMLLGMLFSGLFYREIERVWLFSHILIAAALADGIMQSDNRRGRVVLAALMLTALFVHSVIFRAALRVSW